MMINCSDKRKIKNWKFACWKYFFISLFPLCSRVVRRQIFAWLISDVGYQNSSGNLQFIYQVACADS